VTRRIVLAALFACLTVGTAAAQSCESRAVGANGKPLHGAAQMSFVRKCKQRGSSTWSTISPLANVVAVSVPPIAVAANMLRREIGLSVIVMINSPMWLG
jgi:hypothetical protein